MKKVLVTALVMTVAVAAAGCGSSKDTTSSAAPAASSAAAAADTAASAAEAAVDTAASAAENAVEEVISGAEDAVSAAEDVVSSAASMAEELADDEISAAASVTEDMLAIGESVVEDAAAAAGSMAEEVMSEVQSTVEILPLADVESMPEAIDEAFSDVSSAVTAVEGVESAVTAVEGVESAAEDAGGVMSYAEYAAAPMDSKVTVETYVQAKQSWWEDKATVYTQDEDGAYFIYNMECSEEDYDKLTEGQKIVVTGYKSEWSGEVEIVDASFELADGNYVAGVKDVTALLGTDELIESQNQKAAFKGMTVEASKDAEGNEAAFLYNWDGSGNEGDNSDLYFNASIDGATYTFVVESYLCDQDSDVYKAVQGLNVGDKIDMEGFLYWYEGAQPHIVSVVAAE